MKATSTTSETLKHSRVVIVTYFLPVTVVVEESLSYFGANDKLSTDSMAATGPPSRYHFRSHSDANRLPYSPKIAHKTSPTKRAVSPHEAPLKFLIETSTQGNIGLHKAVDALGSGIGSRLWIGYPGCKFENLKAHDRKSICDKLFENEHQCIPVFLSDAEFNGHYTKFCKEVLWPAMHYNLPEYLKDANNERESWNYYVKANQLFADAVVENYKANDIIWVHDYHLFLVPQLVRKKIPDATIGFFLHIPFPSSEVFRCLPVRKELLNGLLGADLIGFQTYEFARHFLKTCTRILGYESTPKGILLENNVLSVGIFPIGIDPVSLSAKRESAEVEQMIKMLEEKYSGRKVIVGRDKLDPIKGVRQKFYAYETFLNTFPEYQGKVVLVQVALSTTEHPELQRQVNDLVSRINSKFGSIEYTPVVYLHQDISFPHYLALLSMADACLITSLRDGMNLTSHEYVFCQEDKHSPLIISEFTGTYGSFGAALRVNPWNYREVAQAIYDSLNMSFDDKIKYHKELLRHVVSNTAAYWAESFLIELVRISSDMQGRFATTVPHLKHNALVELYKNAPKVILFLNYDGTLAPYEKTPHIEGSNDNLIEILTRLTSNPKLSAYVLSGRTKDSLLKRLGKIPNLGLSAENGAYFKKIGSETWSGVTAVDSSWQNKVVEIFEYYTERTPGSLIEKKDLSIVWHYRMADANFGLWQARECQNHISDSLENIYPIHAILNAKNIEVRPRDISKANLARQILSEMDNEEKLVICIGNERSDEEIFHLFRQLKARGSKSTYISCSVGSKSTTGDFFTTGVVEVLEVLKRLSNEQ